jgi:hypothetical protein
MAKGNGSAGRLVNRANLAENIANALRLRQTARRTGNTTLERELTQRINRLERQFRA